MPEYPFEPKSNAHLLPGQFWGVPLSDGRWACGRVLAVKTQSDALIRPPAAQFELRRTTRSVSLQHHVAGFNQPRIAADLARWPRRAIMTHCDEHSRVSA